MMKRSARTLALQAAVAALIAGLAVAQQPPVPQAPGQPGAMPKISTVELTEDSAKNAVDAYLTLREKYGDKMPPTNQAQALAEGTAAATEFNSVVSAKGFENPQEWQATITSVALAQGFLKKGNAADVDKKIAELEANTQIPAAYKQQMLGMIKSMRPSENNLKVVKGLLDDPTYAKKIAEIEK